MPSRRDVLATAGALAAASLAGCQTPSDGSTRNDYPEGVVFDDGWRSPNHDGANTRSVRDGPTLTDPEVAATLPPSHGGVTGADGRVFLARRSTLRAFDAASGDALWTASADGTHPPSVLGDVVYAPHPETPVVRGFDAESGDVVETHDLPARAVTPPAWSNGRDSFAVALAGGRLAGVPVGSGETWTADPWGGVEAHLAHNMNTVVAATTTGEVYAYGARGTPRWRTNLGAVDLVAPVVGDERVYVGGWDGTIVGLSPTDGGRVWTRERAFVDAPLAFDGTRLYHAAGDLVAFDAATGETEWTYDATASCAPAVVDDTVYVGRDDGALAALDAASGEERWTLALGSSVGPTVAAVGDALVAAGTTDDGRMATFLVR
ncbi:PQQ-binding-like beta-propeller repeat protein [Halarchaeum sp. CBA1220]|uniref:outer membrane protein assembly factor BamB family protein n=1 Tax=Halarchaeum sp. CBA1220 TaxID=1853682 RepID=UPI000F3A9CD7|nr:PQQ-binding-like beta-propeller repeat protein [Halarchaeum sp. CBA1220]QLC33004.1 PQQ-binding-like beta-propeller repeat protein [Halarchaeum sp. CBA1220]